MENTAAKPATGYHFDTSKGEFVNVDSGHHPPGQGRLLRVPAGIVALAAPVLSVAYVIFLPLTGIMAGFAFLGAQLRKLGLTAGRVFKHESAD